MRVILADDAVVIREGVARLLADEGVEVVAQVGDADAPRRAVTEQPVDVVVTDIRMPPAFSDDGLRAAEDIRAAHPEVAVLVLSRREVLALMAEGRTDRGIREALWLSQKTVETHVRSIFPKLDLPVTPTDNRRVHAVLTFLRR
jgi:DNA-binding NarL/FixJ family response regulator